ncbi:MAG: TetR/AcrR family transcriptional regulator [Lachnospiraceae bacterium]|nr:TetR/AcrR family transcriptional regulator [Lachnospiraceae bacterium]
MNEKFFDLKKEKQDRMINAALKIFAKNGYAHASTDDIVKEAGISKGLLFHYFINKIGLYSFIYDYSARFISLEMTSLVDKTDNDYFSLQLQIKSSYASVMKSYPYMVAFMYSTLNEDVVEAMQEVFDKKEILPKKIREYLDYANTSAIAEGTDISRLDEMIDYTSEAVMRKALSINEERPENYLTEIKKHIIMLRNFNR